MKLWKFSEDNTTVTSTYQFGRKVGCVYANDENQTQTASDLGGDGASYDTTNPEDDKYYWNPNNETTTDWYTSSSSKQLSEWPTHNGITGYVENKLDNPCPSGWTVPAKTCMDALVENSITAKADKVFTVGGVSQTGYWLCTKKGNIDEFPLLFLPYAGFRDKGKNAACSGLDSKGRYWSATISNTQAYNLDLEKSTAAIKSRARSSAYSVRCIMSTTN